MTVLAVMLFISSVDTPSNGNENLATFGAFASCCCGLGFFILGSALRPSVNDQVRIKPRQHAFTNRESSEQPGVGMIVDFTHGAIDGGSTSALSAAMSEHYGKFGMGHSVGVVGRAQTSKTWEQTLVDFGSYHVAPNTNIRGKKTDSKRSGPSQQKGNFWSEQPSNAVEQCVLDARNLNVLKASKWTVADPELYGANAMATTVNDWTLVFGTLNERTVLWFDAPPEVLNEWTERLNELARYHEGALEILLTGQEGDEHTTAVLAYLDMTRAEVLSSESSGDSNDAQPSISPSSTISPPSITFEGEEDDDS
jgi:hypothetical protein